MPEATRADLVIRGRIATLTGSSGFGWVEALAIRAGRVLAGGTWSDVEPLAGAATRQWRLGHDVLVTPAITDAHLHLAAAAIAAGQPDLTGLARAAVCAVIAATHEQRLAAGDADGWLLGHGWSFAALGEHPDAAWLDEAAPGRPVALWAHDHHSRWLSARAVQLAGLAAQADPPAGRIERDTDGRPTGIMYETAAGLVDTIIPQPTSDDVDWAIGAYARTLAELGVTSVHDPGGVAPDPELRLGPTLYREMAHGGRLPLRVTACVRAEQLERAIEMGFRSGQTESEPEQLAGPGSGRYHDGWLKLFSDGALGSRTAALLAPYEVDDPAGPPPGGPTGMPLLDREQLADLAGRAAAAGIASQIHAIGDGAVRTVLDVLESILSVDGARHRIEHAQLVHPDDLLRFSALGVAASVQPCHLLSDAEAMRLAWGDRAATAFPLADLDRAGTLLPFGTDAPVEPPDPWPGIAAAVIRQGPAWRFGEPFHPEQAISLERAIRAACLDGPRSAMRTDEGHLGDGARADLLVLPASVLAAPVDPEVLGRTRPQATLLDGRLLYEAPDFDP